MHVWLNLDTIKYYERKDQMYKMIHLLDGIYHLLEHNHLHTKESPDFNGILVQEFEKYHRYLFRRIMSPIEISYEYESPFNFQSIGVGKESLNSRSKSLLFGNHNIFFDDKYDYLEDAKFVLKTWINQLHAHNYNKDCPKKFKVTNLNKNCQLIRYFPGVALKIISQCTSNGSSGYSKAFKKFQKN